MQFNQWFKNGDHPDDGVVDGYKWEGKVVRRNRLPRQPGSTICKLCNTNYHYHGWIDNGYANQTVCPGGWVISLDHSYYSGARGIYCVMLSKQ